jgi:flagellin
MIINHNIAALNTHRQMGSAQSAQMNSMEKLSSGLRINSAKDDAAGLSISEKMRGQIRGLEQASANAQDGISLMQTAEGALNETHSILQRMRELSVQSANDTNTTDDRAEIQKEIEQLTAEVDRIGNATEFNSKKLLNGGAGIEATQTTGTGIKVLEGTEGVKAGGDLALTGITAAKAASVTIDSATAMTVGTDTDLSVNGVTVSLTAGMTGAQVEEALNAVSSTTGVTATYDTANFSLALSTTDTGSDAKLEITDLTLTAAGAASDTFVGGAVTMVDQGGNNLLTAARTDASVATVMGNDASVTIDAATTGAIDPTFSANGNKVTFHGGQFDGLVLDVEDASATSTLHIDANNSLSLQIGANEDQDINITISDMRSSALGVDSLDVTSTAGASQAITTIDAAIKSVSSERSKLGAFQNRLDHTINNLNTSAENLTSAESRIRDVDMAKEMMNQTKNSILAQASQAMLAQANQQPQAILQLLR